MTSRRSKRVYNKLEAMAKILVVEDERNLLEMLRYNLAREGYEVLPATDGQEALELASQHSPDLVVLDIMLPKLDGFEVCRRLRRTMTMPIVMLTAKTEEVDRVVGLELGADDYVPKPFSMRELLARIRAMLRRAEMARPSEALLRVGELTLDPTRREARLGEKTLSLKPKEFNLLAFLLRNRGRVFSREKLLEEVWGYDYAGGTRTVDVHIRWLREKIEADPSHPRYLHTLRGVGYKLEG